MSPRLACLMTGLMLTLAACMQPENRAPAASDTPMPATTTQPAPPSGGAEPEPGVTRPSPEPAVDECGANKLGSYVNQLPTSDAMAKIRQTIGHNRIRTIKPGDVVTMDFRPDRLNVEIGQDGRIKLFRCG